MPKLALSTKLSNINNEVKALVVMFVLYFVGVLGFVFLKNWNFILLTPLNLLISLFVALRFQEDRGVHFYLTAVAVATIGFFIEVIGVNTGLIFGAYRYGPVLGVSWLSTPLSISVNWLLLVYCSAALVNLGLPTHCSRLLRALIASLLMVGLDVVIEPVAIATDMWRWELVQVPLQNYVGWFVSAFLLHYLMLFFTNIGSNRVAAAIFLMQCAFFAVLNLLL